MFKKAIAWIKYLYYNFHFSGKHYEVKRQKNRLEKRKKENQSTQEKWEKFEEEEVPQEDGRQRWNPIYHIRRTILQTEKKRKPKTVERRKDAFEKHKSEAESLLSKRNYYAEKIGKEKKEISV